MEYVGIWLALAVTAVAVLVVGATVAGGATWVAAIVALVACVLAPVVLDRRLTAVFRRLQPNARSTIVQMLAITNGVWLVLLVLLVPTCVRGALERHGVWMFPGGGSPALRDGITRAAAHIPRSEGVESSPAGRASSEGATTARPAPTLAPAASRETATSAPVAAPTIRPPDDVDDDSPAGRVFRERSASVVVIRTRAPVPKDSPLAAIYEALGLDLTEGLGRAYFPSRRRVPAASGHDAVRITDLMDARASDEKPPRPTRMVTLGSASITDIT